MRCFNHHDKDALGSCKHCAKGLCADCAADLGFGLACRNLHEPQVEAVNSLVHRNVQANRVAPAAWYIGPAFLAFMGAIFSGFGLFFSPQPSAFMILLGLGFIAYSAFSFAINYRVLKSSRKQA